jgi:hypothetical protein
LRRALEVVVGRGAIRVRLHDEPGACDTLQVLGPRAQRVVGSRD